MKKKVTMLISCFLLVCSGNNAQAVSILDLHVNFHGLSTESSDFVSNGILCLDTLSATAVDSSSSQYVSSPQVNMQTNAASAIVNNATATASSFNYYPEVGNQWGCTFTGDLHAAVDGISNQFSYASLDLVYYMYFDHTYDPNAMMVHEDSLLMQNATEFNGLYMGDPLDSVKFSISSEVTIKNLTTGHDSWPHVYSAEVQLPGTGQPLNWEDIYNQPDLNIRYDPQTGQINGFVGGALYYRGAGNTLANGDQGLIIERVHIDVSAGNPVPEPFSLLPVGSGLLGLAGFRRILKR